MSRTIVEMDGVRLSIAGWARRVKMNPITLAKRLRDGVPIREALNPASRKSSGGGWYKLRGIGKGLTEFEHRLIAANALGRPLPRSARVHHVNGDIRDNGRGNLVLCQSDAYHQLLHYRQRAMDESGDPNHVYCVYCKRWGSPDSMTVKISPTRAYHKACNNSYHKALRARRSNHFNHGEP